jgi:hypothetical protein
VSNRAFLISIGAALVSALLFVLLPVLDGGMSRSALLLAGARSFFVLVAVFEFWIWVQYLPRLCLVERQDRITTYRDSTRLFLGLGAFLVWLAAETIQPGIKVQDESRVFIGLMGAFFIVVGILSLVLLRRAWPSAEDPSRIEFKLVRSSPFGDLYNLGLLLLERKTDPVERRKLELALEKTRKGSRLKPARPLSGDRS